MNEQEPFLLPVSYWPRRTGIFWWDDFRRDEVVRELHLAAAAGVSQLHVTLPWQVFQPHSTRLSVTAMRDLEALLRVAADLGICCLVAMTAATLHGVPTVPTWLYELDVDENAVLIRVMRRLYEDPVALDAAATGVGEVTREFAGHPAVTGWIVGDGLMSVAPPRSADHFVEWVERIRTAVVARGSRLWHGVSARDVALQPALNIRSLAEAGMGVYVHLDWMPHWLSNGREWASLLCKYVRALGGLPPLIGAEHEVRWVNPRMSEEAAGNAPDRVRNAGGAGLIWPALFDYDPQLAVRPPYNRLPGELHEGLIPTGTTLSPASLAWLSAPHEQVTVDSIYPPLDEELRARDPAGYLREVWREFGA